MQKPAFTVEQTKTAADYGQFVIEPLPQGFGQTMGNSLRRILLMFLPGGAITQVKIKGVRHQFSTLKGLREDIVELILNLKKINFKVDSEEPVKLTLSKTGPGEIHASDITLPATVMVANPDEYIGLLADKTAKLEAEIWVSQGTGYVPSEERTTSEIGMIPVDSLYSPIRRVNFTVEETRVGRETNFDKVILDVWTNGAIDAKDAVGKAAEILVTYFQYIYQPSEELVQVRKEDHVSDAVLHSPVEELELSVRVINALKKGGYKTLGDFQGKKRSELERVRNLGEKSIKTLEQQLAAKGITFES